MDSKRGTHVARKALRAVSAAGLVIVLVGGMCVAPVSAATKSGDKTRVVSYRAFDRAEIENLQRWVSAGHEDWCKDARLVAAEELKRLAADFADGATELTAVETGEPVGGSGNANSDGINGAKKVVFEWTPLDGQATYRVTLERFDWLLPIAGDANSVVWGPTVTEIQIHQ
jgi:hypothetical protein